MTRIFFKITQFDEIFRFFEEKQAGLYRGWVEGAGSETDQV